MPETKFSWWGGVDMVMNQIGSLPSKSLYSSKGDVLYILSVVLRGNSASTSPPQGDLAISGDISDDQN